MDRSIAKRVANTVIRLLIRDMGMRIAFLIQDYEDWHRTRANIRYRQTKRQTENLGLTDMPQLGISVNPI